MKTNIKTLLIAVILSVTFAGCKKDNKIASTESGALTVANIVSGGSQLKFNISTQTVNSNNSTTIPVASGQRQVKLFAADNPATVYFDKSINIANADYYSLFLAGNSPLAVDQVLIKESYSNYTDSLCGVRFINLSPASNPISVNIQGQTAGSEVINLSYKDYSSFKQHPAKKLNNNYVFEIRNAATNAVILTYTMNTPAFRNVTIALRGINGGAPSGAVTLINHP